MPGETKKLTSIRLILVGERTFSTRTKEKGKCETRLAKAAKMLEKLCPRETSGEAIKLSVATTVNSRAEVRRGAEWSRMLMTAYVPTVRSD